MKIQTVVHRSRPQSRNPGSPGAEARSADTVALSTGPTPERPASTGWLRRGLKWAGREALDLAMAGGGLAAAAAAPVFFGPGVGIPLAAGASAVGFGLHGKLTGDPEVAVLAEAGLGVGAFAALSGAMTGPLGVAVMGALGVGCAAFAKVFRAADQAR